MTKPKKLAPEYEQVIQHAEYDIASLEMAKHLITPATYRAARRDILRRSIIAVIAKSTHEHTPVLNLSQVNKGGPDA